MQAYRIESKAGEICGTYHGETPAEALLAMHREAGYGPDDAWIEDDELCFRDDDTREMCGDTTAWIIKRQDIHCPLCIVEVNGDYRGDRMLGVLGVAEIKALCPDHLSDLADHADLRIAEGRLDAKAWDEVYLAPRRAVAGKIFRNPDLQ